MKKLAMTSKADQNSKWILEDDQDHNVYLDSCPFTPGTTIIQAKNVNCASIFQLPVEEYNKTFLVAKKWAKILSEKLPVERCAMMSVPTEDQAQVKLIPLHGIGPDWKPILAEQVEFHEQYPGFCTSKNGPRATDVSLKSIQDQIRDKLQIQEQSYDFYGDQKNDNLFAKIVKGEIEQWRVWEDKDHVAFLTPFPNVPGFTVLVPRKHLSSDIFSLEQDDYLKILQASHTVYTLLKQAMNLDDCAMIFEGYEIDYAHAKIIPIIKPRIFSRDLDKIDYCTTYKGYVTSMNGLRASDQDLGKLQSIIKS